MFWKKKILSISEASNIGARVKAVLADSEDVLDQAKQMLGNNEEISPEKLLHDVTKTILNKIQKSNLYGPSLLTNDQFLTYIWETLQSLPTISDTNQPDTTSAPSTEKKLDVLLMRLEQKAKALQHSLSKYWLQETLSLVSKALRGLCEKLLESTNTLQIPIQLLDIFGHLMQHGEWHIKKLTLSILCSLVKNDKATLPKDILASENLLMGLTRTVNCPEHSNLYCHNNVAYFLFQTLHKAEDQRFSKHLHPVLSPLFRSPIEYPEQASKYLLLVLVEREVHQNSINPDIGILVDCLLDLESAERLSDKNSNQGLKYVAKGFNALAKQSRHLGPKSLVRRDVIDCLTRVSAVGDSNLQSKTHFSKAAILLASRLDNPSEAEFVIEHFTSAAEDTPDRLQVFYYCGEPFLEEIAAYSSMLPAQRDKLSTLLKNMVTYPGFNPHNKFITTLLSGFNLMPELQNTLADCIEICVSDPNFQNNLTHDHLKIISSWRDSDHEVIRGCFYKIRTQLLHDGNLNEDNYTYLLGLITPDVLETEK